MSTRWGGADLVLGRRERVDHRRGRRRGELTADTTCRVAGAAESDVEAMTRRGQHPRGELLSALGPRWLDFSADSSSSRRLEHDVGAMSVARAGRYGRAATAGGDCSSPASRHREPGVRVFYGHDRVPAPGEAVSGGSVKIQRLGTRFPNHPTGFSVVYLGVELDPARSRAAPRPRPPEARCPRRQPRRRGLSGVGGPDTEAVNRPLRSLLAAADHVLYQSDFSKRSADEWVGSPGGTWEVRAQRRRRRFLLSRRREGRR